MILSILGWLAAFWAALTISIYAHECGHWWAALACGFRPGLPRIIFRNGVPVAGSVDVFEVGVNRTTVGAFLAMVAAGYAANFVLLCTSFVLYVHGGWALAFATVVVNVYLLLRGVVDASPDSDIDRIRTIFAGSVTVTVDPDEGPEGRRLT